MYHTIVYHRKEKTFTVDRLMKNGVIRSTNYHPNENKAYLLFALLGRMSSIEWAENKKIVMVANKKK